MDIITAKTLYITSDYNIFNIFWRHLISVFLFKKKTILSSLVSVVYAVSLLLKGFTSSKSRLSIRSKASRSYEASGALVWGSTGVFRHEVTRAFVRCAFAMIPKYRLQFPEATKKRFIYLFCLSERLKKSPNLLSNRDGLLHNGSDARPEIEVSVENKSMMVCILNFVFCILTYFRL